MGTYTRDDVQTHYGSDRPAVNVKIHGTIEDAWKDFQRGEDPDEGFTLEWIRENVSEEQLDRLFWDQCSWEFEYLEAWATTDEDSLFPDDNVTLELDGRSGGWCVVTGLPDIEEWDAVRLMRWRKFERVARSIADGVLESMLNTLYINEWEWQKNEAAEAERAANLDVATVPA